MDGRLAGTLGDCGILSFGHGKVLDVGYGGAAVLNAGPVAGALSPLLDEEWDKINRCDAADDAALSAFDRTLKRLYNTRYEDFRSGSLTEELHGLLSRCAPHTHRVDADRLDRALSPGTLAGAPARVRARNDRAAWWISKLERACAPAVTGIIRHKAGTYWRLNAMIDPSVRHTILRAGLAAGLPISSWHPPLYWLVPDAAVIGNRDRETRFADCVLNLWVEGIEDWEGYGAAIERIFLMKSAAARA